MDDIDNLIQEIDEEFPEFREMLQEMYADEKRNWKRLYKRARFWNWVLGFAAAAMLVAFFGVVWIK